MPSPDPELEASYLQYGRYLMICGSRDGLPMGLQGAWIDTNEPGWMGDYHTDVNIQMNYWMADRTGLPSCFDALTDYCLAQLPSWTDVTQRLFNDPRNRFRNSSGKVAGWTVGISTNIDGGSGWQWHPAGSAWLANTLFEHYEYSQDPELLARIYPLIKGACEFWEARLIPHLVTDHVTGQTREALVADKDWSPEHGPQDALGITYAQELVWTLFTNYHTASEVLGKDAGYRQTIDGLRDRLYLPQVSPTTGWLEEWMTPDNLGEIEHRHLSPLMGFFPGDRIDHDSSPADLLTGVWNLLNARGTSIYGWANAWRALCWARFKEGEKAYQMIIKNLQPSTGSVGGTALNLFDIWPLDSNQQHLPDRRELRHAVGDGRHAGLLPSRPHRVAARASRGLGGARTDHRGRRPRRFHRRPVLAQGQGQGGGDPQRRRPYHRGRRRREDPHRAACRGRGRHAPVVMNLC